MPVTPGSGGTALGCGLGYPELAKKLLCNVVVTFTHRLEEVVMFGPSAIDS